MKYQRLIMLAAVLWATAGIIGCASGQEEVKTPKEYNLDKPKGLPCPKACWKYPGSVFIKGIMIQSMPYRTKKENCSGWPGAIKNNTM